MNACGKRMVVRRWGGALLVVIATLTLLVGCGAGKARTSAGASTTTRTTGTGAAGATATTGVTSTSGATASTVTRVTAAVASGGGSDAGSTFCRDSRALQAQQARELKSFSNGPGAVKKLEQRALAELPTFVAEAPSSIKAAVVKVAQEDRALYLQLAAANFDYTKLGPAATAIFQNPTFVRATSEIADYMSRGCGIKATTGTT